MGLELGKRLQLRPFWRDRVQSVEGDRVLAIGEDRLKCSFDNNRLLTFVSKIFIEEGLKLSL